MLGHSASEQKVRTCHHTGDEIIDQLSLVGTGIKVCRMYNECRQGTLGGLYIIKYVLLYIYNIIYNYILYI